MTYKEFERRIQGMAAAATDADRLCFSRDTIGLLHSSAHQALSTELTEAEREVLSEILVGVESGALNGLRPKLKALTDSLCSDEVRAIEFHPYITELLCAIDNLLGYSETKDSDYIRRLAVNMVNSIDHAIGGDSAAYSINNIMGAEQMRVEHERQKRLLIGP